MLALFRSALCVSCLLPVVWGMYVCGGSGQAGVTAVTQGHHPRGRSRQAGWRGRLIDRHPHFVRLLRSDGSETHGRHTLWGMLHTQFR